MKPNSMYMWANFALAAAQVAFGIGSVIGDLGLPNTNPVLFGLVREGIAGPLLCLLAMWSAYRDKADRILPTWAHVPRFLVCGLAIFTNQFCAITGIKLAGGVTMAVWQPTQPIFSLVLAILLKYERGSFLKIAGIIVSFLGVLFMVLYDAEGNDKSIGEVVAGNMMFFFNCLGSSMYVVASKPLLKTFPPISVTGFSYIIASVFMAIACVIVNSSQALLTFVCPPEDDSDEKDSCGDGWHIPAGAMWALAYWILMTSIFAYCMITWANQHADASLVSAYTVLQPVTAAVAACIVIATTEPPHYDLHGAGIADLGAIGIFIGLSMVIYDSRKERRRIQEQQHLMGASSLADSSPDK